VARVGDKTAPLELSCSCGKLRGHISADAARSGAHVVCYCRDCRATELYFKQPDPAPGPVDLFQTMPDALTITQGGEHIGLFRLSPRGTMRWYATCCNTPLFNTSSTAKFPFVGINVASITTPEQLGPVICKAYAPRTGGKTAHEGLTRVIWRMLPQVLATRLSGRWRQTPFFDTETGKPVAEAVVPSKEERAALYPAQRSTKG